MKPGGFVRAALVNSDDSRFIHEALSALSRRRLYVGLRTMSNLQSEMDLAVSRFVSEITDLARRAAVSMLEASLGGNARSRVRTRGAAEGRRARADLEALRDGFVSFVAKHPGLRIEQINAKLGTTTKDLALPVRKLIADGIIKTKGRKRSTTYFAK